MRFSTNSLTNCYYYATTLQIQPYSWTDWLSLSFNVPPDTSTGHFIHISHCSNRAVVSQATDRPRHECSRCCGQALEPSNCEPDTALPLAQKDVSVACSQQLETLLPRHTSYACDRSSPRLKWSYWLDIRSNTSKIFQYEQKITTH